MNLSLIRECFVATRPHFEIVFDYFIDDLCSRNPAARGLFNPAQRAQHRLALCNGLTHVVEFLEEPDHLEDYLRKMGVRHQRFGVSPEMYGWFSQSLLATLEYYFDAQWTEDLKLAWTELCDYVSNHLRAGLLQKSSVAIQAPQNLQGGTPGVDSASDELIRQKARQLLVDALESELQGEFGGVVREKIREALLCAIEREAGRLAQSELRRPNSGRS